MSTNLNDLRARRLARIARVLGGARTVAKATDDLLTEGSGGRDKAEQELFEFCQRDPDCVAVLTRYDVAPETLVALYYRLRQVGAGQWVGRHWPPVSGLGYPDALEFLMSHQHQLSDSELAKGLLELLRDGRLERVSEMGWWQRFLLRMRLHARLGAFTRARKSGRSPAEARLDVDRQYPPTPEDIAFERYYYAK